MYPPPPESGPPPQWAPNESGPRASFWRRFAAWLIDIILLGIPSSILAASIGGSSARYGVGTVLSLLYATLMIGSARGQTVGQMALGIRVIDFNTGGPIGYGRAFIRAVVAIASALPCFLGYFWMLWDKEKQCWHDKAATDVVVPVRYYPLQN